MKRFVPLTMAALLAISVPGPSRAAEIVPAPRPPEGVESAWLAGEWQAYAARFVTAEGRVLDNGNGNVSHSEGQGYGLLLAAKAGDAARFETLWAWTSKTLMIRKDGLAAWRWDPSARKVTDTNNATDGDILIAWGLAEGARRFNRPDYRRAAEAIARAVGAVATLPTRSGRVFLPGTTGFGAGAQKDGPVVNLSYWIFPAFPTLQDLAPRVNWEALRRSGLALLQQSRFGTSGLPTDWESLAGAHPRPAAGFPASFSYNAIRIPLYLAMDGGEDTREALRPFTGDWSRTPPVPRPPDGKGSDVSVPVSDAGYDLVLAVARCAAAGEAIPAKMISTRSDLYYPETLRLLAAITVQERFPSCS